MATRAQKTANSKVKYLTLFDTKAANITQTCKAVQISRQTFYRWCEEDDDFNNRIFEIKESLVDFAEASLLAMIKEKNVSATIFFLKTQGKHRGYGE